MQKHTLPRTLTVRRENMFDTAVRLVMASLRDQPYVSEVNKEWLTVWLTVKPKTFVGLNVMLVSYRITEIEGLTRAELKSLARARVHIPTFESLMRSRKFVYEYLDSVDSYSIGGYTYTRTTGDKPWVDVERNRSLANWELAHIIGAWYEEGNLSQREYRNKWFVKLKDFLTK